MRNQIHAPWALSASPRLLKNVYMGKKTNDRHFQATKIQNNFIHDAQHLSQISSNSQANCLNTKDLGESQLWQHHSGNHTRTMDIGLPDHELDGGLKPRRKSQSPWRPGWRARSDSKSPSMIQWRWQRSQLTWESGNYKVHFLRADYSVGIFLSWGP